MMQAYEIVFVMQNKVVHTILNNNDADVKKIIDFMKNAQPYDVLDFRLVSGGRFITCRKDIMYVEVNPQLDLGSVGEM